MRWFLVCLVLVAVAVGALYYWVYLPQLKELETARREASLCLQDLSSLRGQLTDVEQKLEFFEQTSAELADEVRKKEDELSTLRGTQDELLAELQQEIADGKIQVERLRGQLTVDMVDELLFDSGEADLNSAGMKVLKRVGAVLKKAQDRQIIVHGHTDNVKIVGRLAKTFPTNWELSAARAVNVARFLQDEVGIDPERLSAIAFSEYRPRADNSTREGRQKNRRIEIVLGTLPVGASAAAPGGEAPAGETPPHSDEAEAPEGGGDNPA
jgi:chemotaxis protein MotB